MRMIESLLSVEEACWRCQCMSGLGGLWIRTVSAAQSLAEEFHHGLGTAMALALYSLA